MTACKLFFFQLINKDVTRTTVSDLIFETELAPPVTNWMIPLVQSFTACMPLLTAASKLKLQRRYRWASKNINKNNYLIYQFN